MVRLVLSAVVLGWAMTAAAPLPAAGPVPDNAFLVLEVRQPMRLARHPLLIRLWDEVRPSHTVRRALQSPEFDRVRQAAALLETAAGTDGRTALERLTAGGLILAVTPGPPPQAVLVLTSDDPALLAHVTEHARQEVLRRVPDDRPGAAIITEPHRGIACYKLGEAWYAVRDQRLVLSDSKDLLKQTLDRLEDHPTPATAADHDAPLARLWVDLETVRRAPPAQNLLSLPSDDPGRIAFLGGWLDLLRTSDEATAELTLGGDSRNPVSAGNRVSANAGEAPGRLIPDPSPPPSSGGVQPRRSMAGERGDRMSDESLELVIHFPTGAGDGTPALRGFFATAGERAAPLLEPPGTIYTASWYRDYAALWRNRAELVTAETLAAVEKADADSRRQLSVFQLDSSLSGLAQQFGPHFRVVVARQQETGYRVPLTDRLPAAALAVDVRDAAAFQEKVMPVFRFLALISAFQPMGPKMRPQTYRDATLAGLWFRDDDATAETGNRGRFNFSPTWTLTRGHFVAGTTHELVCRMIDELDAQSAAGATTAPAATELQRFSFPELAAAARDLREAVVRGLALNWGLTFDEAEHEATVFERALSGLSEITTRATFDRGGFEYRMTIGPP